MDLPYSKWLVGAESANSSLTEEDAFDAFTSALSDLIEAKHAFQQIMVALISYPVFFESLLSLPLDFETSPLMVQALRKATEIKAAYGRLCDDLVNITPLAFDSLTGARARPVSIVSSTAIDTLDEKEDAVPNVLTVLTAAHAQLSDNRRPDTLDDVTTALLYAARALYRQRSTLL